MKFITLKNDYIELTLCSLGASIFRLTYNKEDMILSPINEKDFFKEGIYYGKTVGRICGRVLKDNQVVLHGGPNGLSWQDFNYVKEDNKVTFTYLSKGDESSREGSLLVKVTYTLIANSLKIETEITPDCPMMVYLTNHTFFCLGENCVNNLSLEMDSDIYTTYDEKLLPLKKENVRDKFDFRKLTNVMTYGELDNYFILNNGSVLLQSNKYQLKLTTDYKGVHLYSDYFLDDVKTRLSSIDHHRALAIEPQDDKLEKQLLVPNKTVKRTTLYTFNKLG